jgi:hypothetical protein
MYFKVKQGTKLFDDLKKLEEKMESCFDSSVELLEDIFGDESENMNFVPDFTKLAGGIIAVQLEKRRKGWEKHLAPWAEGQNLYKPNERMKEMKEAVERMKNLPTVSESEINSIINFEKIKDEGRVLTCPGFMFFDDLVVFDFPDYITEEYYKPVDGMVEITEEEYNNLTS